VVGKMNLEVKASTIVRAIGKNDTFMRLYMVKKILWEKKKMNVLGTMGASLPPWKPFTRCLSYIIYLSTDNTTYPQITRIIHRGQ